MTPDLYADMRRAMVVSQLRPSGVGDPRVLDAMGGEPREDYVPEARRSTAYADRIVPLPDGLAMNPPIVTGQMLDAAHIGDGDRVLIVSDPTGYVSALARRLTSNVATLHGVDGAGGPSDKFDVILIDGAVEVIPDALIEALDADGRLVSGVVEHGVTRIAVGRRGGGGFALIPFVDAEMAILPQFARLRAFSF